QVTVTRTESEALLLESNLIKQFKPRYNVTLRDDKSYPYIYVSIDDEFPRLAFDRGKRQGKGRYFGPYPSASAVRETLGQLQKLFQVRQCEDAFFRNRSRPCLQYQIKRCTAPCVNLVSREEYRRDVDNVVQFLEGRNDAVIQSLVERMDTAAENLDYESAARYRDRIQYLRRVYDKQYISGEQGDIDIIACAVRGGMGCVQVFYIRNGRNLGNKAFFPRMPEDATSGDVLQGFITQYYLQHDIARELLISESIEDQALVEQMLSEQAGRKVTVSSRLRGERARWVRMALTNAETTLVARLASRQGMLARLEDLQKLLQLDSPPERMECFDISHTQGEATVASCVVFDQNGPVKSDYRRFNIRDVTPGDDYGAMRQALERRYTRLKKGEGKLPDVLFIDGGKGQVGEALRVLEELQVEGVLVVGVAKGPDRLAGQERLIVPQIDKILQTASDRPALHLIQSIRDEAHRFAISGHRAQRKKTRNRSPLEDIPGLGPKRRQQLLKNFGGLQGLKKAGVEELAGISGIGKQLAEQIYATLHQN
ncbi:MAG TPA: excinuclease ABC subunit UvrC, partial [Gammaproteobacteria bacterium]